MSRALVPLAPLAPKNPEPVFSAAANHPHADFIAHLIATSGKAPQTCLRRRAAPHEAIAAYGALDRRPPLLGRTLSRSL